jgi:hypothetical protein
MTQKVFLKVNRGMTDKTLVCVYPWEKSLIESVHAQDCEPVSIDEMCSMKDVVKIEKQKLNHGDRFAPGLRDQLIEMATVHPEEDPANDPATEYGRMADKYGMDKDIPIPVVTRVYGEFSSGAFTEALKKFKSEMPHGELVKGVPKSATHVAKMSVAELRDECARRGIGFTTEMSKAQLQELLKVAA